MPGLNTLIRNEFMVRFGQAPRLESGILVKRWATGPNKGPNGARGEFHLTAAQNLRKLAKLIPMPEPSPAEGPAGPSRSARRHSVGT